MAKKEKISRKQLLKEPDKIITTTSRLIQFAAAHRTGVVIGAVGFLGVVIVIALVRYFAVQNENRAFAELHKVLTTYEEQRAADGAPDATKAVGAEMEKIVEKYSGNTGGKIACLRYADICLAAGRPEKAIEYYQKALAYFRQDPALGNLVLAGLAHAYQKSGDTAKSMEYFQMIVSGADKVLQDDALFHLAALYAQAGDLEKSAAFHKRLRSEFPSSIFVQWIADKTS